MHLSHSKSSTFSFLFYFAKRQRVKFSILIFAFTIWSASDAVFPYFLKRIVNAIEVYKGERAGIYSAVAGVLALIILFWVMSEILMRIEGIVQIYTFPRFRANIRSAVFDYVTSHSHEYFANNFAGNIAKKLADLPTSSQSLMEIICFSFTTVIVGSSLVLIMMWLTHPYFAGVLFAWLCVHLSLTFFFLRAGNQLWEVHAESVTELSGKIVDVLSNILNVKLFARQKYEAHYLNTFQEEEIKKAKKAMWLMEISRVGLGVNGLCLIFGMLFTLLHGWVQRWVSMGDLKKKMKQSFWLLGWMWFLTFQLTVFTREKGTIDNALSLIQQSHDIKDKDDAKPLKMSAGEIIFKDVCFAYRQNQTVFENLNVTIPAAEKIGLVGFSGSGKSTFVNLILRFYDIDSGSILIDGQNIATATQDSLRSQIAMIPQDPALFHRSLMENIRYGRLEASDEEVMAAAKLAHCHEFIEKLEEGYHSLVGEKGIKLSGGQRQRIAIARAILKDAPILILDEATSALDSVTEKLIQESLHYLMKNRTTIVVAHRLSTLADMNKIFVFDHGKIIEEGSKQELLNQQGHFARLWNMQTEGFLPDEGKQTQ